MQGNDCSTKSLPLEGRPPTRIPQYHKECLTEEEAEQIYQCLDTQQVVSPIQFCKELQKAPSPRQLAYNRLEEILQEEGTVNPYEFTLFHPEEELPPLPNNCDQYDMLHSLPKHVNTQSMEDWSILSTEVHYTQYPEHTGKIFMVRDCETTLLSEWEKSPQAPTLGSPALPDFPVMEEYLDQYDSITTKLHRTKGFNDKRDVSTTYLGPEKITRQDKFSPEAKFPVSVTSHTWGQLIGGGMMNILMDTGASKCYMSKTFYMKNPKLHKLPKFHTTIKALQVGNGNYVQALFVIPVLISVYGHRFEIYALVAEIQDSIDLVFGMKNMHEVEGEHSSRHSEFRFMNRAIPLFPTETFSLTPGNKRYVKVVAPFLQKLSGIAIVKIVHGLKTITLQCKLQNNLGVLDMINTTDTTMFFSPDLALGIVDIRSLGYYNIRHSVLQYNLSAQLPQYNKMVTKHADRPKSKHHGKADYHAKQKKASNSDPYPWLEKKDPRRDMSDEDILHKFIDLSKSILDEHGKKELMDIVIKYKKAFSLRDEIGECPDIRIDIEVIDATPFFVRPFPISEEDKPIMDWQMQRLVSLGILTRNTTSHTSPVMLITRKITKDKRPVVDFRLLNTRIKRHNTATPLLRDIYQMLGKAQSAVLSCVDLKDAFHSLRLTDKAKDYCGILPYFGSHHYRYEVMPMGLSISPCKWIQYIGFVMEKMPHPENYIAIMDDLLVHSKEADHMDRILDMLKGLVEHGLKLSPKKCQFFRDELVYMGNIFRTGQKGITITPIKTRQEAILNTPTPTTAKECKSFCGVVNYVSLFCPNLQKLLAPIYDLTRKGRPFVWTDLHTHNFEIIKKQMASPPVLTLPTSTGRYILYSDTSKLHTGCALWQVQNGKPRLVGYSSKSLPKACANYGITELEMTGLLYNMLQWKYWLGKKDFDAAVDHRAIPYIMKAKHLPTTDRITRLLEGLNAFTFHLYYVKGKDMILCDFLSRVAADDSDPMDLIPIAFNVYSLLQDHYCKIAVLYAVQTRSSRAASGQAPPPAVHGAVKGVNPNLKPETQAARAVSTPAKAAPMIRTPTPRVVPRPTPKTQIKMRPIPMLTPKTSTYRTPAQPWTSTPAQSPILAPRSRPGVQTPAVNSNMSLRRQLVQALHQQNVPGPSGRSAPDITPRKINFDKESDKRPITQAPTQKSDIVPSAFLGPMPIMQYPPVQATGQVSAPALVEEEPEIDPNMDIPLHETSVEALFRPPEMSDFELPPALSEHVRGKGMLAKNLPKQSDIDRLMKQLNRKILTHTRFPSSLKDLEAAYCSSSAFKDIFQYLRFNRLPTNRRLAKRIEATAQDYYVLGSILFKYMPQKSGDLESVMCIPPSKFDCILDYYHSTVIGGHQGMNKTLRTLSSRFYCPRMADYIRAYVVSCHMCQLFKNSHRFHRPYHKRVYDISQAALTNVSMDIKYMPKSSKGYKFLLVLICEVSNFLVTQPMKEISAKGVCEILVDSFICYFSTPVRIISDQDASFMSTLCQYCFQQFKIQLITVSVTNHKSLQAEHGIKSLSNMIITHLTGLGRDWHVYAKACMLTYNSYASPNLCDLSPFELVFGRKPRIVPILEVTPPIPVTGTFKDAYEILNKKLRYFREMLIKFRDRRYEVMNRAKEFHGYTSGQIVYLFFPGQSLLNTGKKKFTCKFVGPLAIWKCFSPTQFVLMSLDGVVYPYLVEETRLKPGVIRTTKGNVYTLSALRQMVKSGYLLKDSSSM